MTEAPEGDTIATMNSTISPNTTEMLEVLEGATIGQTAYVVFVCLLIIIIIMSNMLVVIVIIKFKLLEQVTNRFVLSLAAADMLVGISAAIFLTVDLTVSAENLSARTQTLLCCLRTGTVTTSLLTSITNLLGVTVDRYIAVIMSLRYPMIMTHTRAVAVIVVCWAWSLSFSFVPMLLFHNDDDCLLETFFNRYHFLAQCLYYFLVLSIIFVLYLKIFNAALKQRRQIDAANQFNQSESSRGDDGDAAERARRSQEAAARRSVMKTVRGFVVVFGGLVACLTPFYAFYTFLSWNGLRYTDGYQRVAETVDVFMFAGSFINPLIYAWMFRDFRNGIKKLFRGQQ